MMMTHERRSAGIWMAATFLIGLFPATLASQEVRSDTCPPGEALTGDLGIGSLECRNCTLRVVSADEDVVQADRRVDSREGPVRVTLAPDRLTHLWVFRSEPEVRAVREDGPADGVLEPGDVIVAIDGDLITTAEAGRKFSDAEIGRPVELTIRRRGELSRVRIQPVARCWKVPTPPPPSPPKGPRPARPAPDALPAPSLRPDRTPPVFPSGWFGFGIRCGDCEIHAGEAESPTVWVFREPPEVFSVEEGSPADRAGLRNGDLLLSFDGAALTSEEGGRRFGAVKAGQTVELTFRRDTSERTARITATERRLPRPPGPPATPRLRYVGTIGDVDIEVHGSGPVIVTVVEPDRELEIVTEDTRIRLRRSR